MEDAPAPGAETVYEGVSYEMEEGFIRLLPTEEQYENIARLYHIAQELGATDAGGFKMLVPHTREKYPFSDPDPDMDV